MRKDSVSDTDMLEGFELSVLINLRVVGEIITLIICKNKKKSTPQARPHGPQPNLEISLGTF